MAFPASWHDPRFLVAIAGVLAVGALAVLLQMSGQFSPLRFGGGALGVTLITTVALALAGRTD